VKAVHPGSWSLRTRLTVLFTLVFAIAGLIVVVVSYVVVQSSLGQPLPRGLSIEQVLPKSAQLPQGLVDQIISEIERQRAATLRSLLVQSGIALVASTALAAVIGWLIAGRVLRPLQRVTETAARITDSSLHERVGLTGGHDEVQDLADSVDAMLARLDRAFDSQSRFVANASHELRTPLAVQRTLLEVEIAEPDASDDLRRVGGQVLRINERHERLVEDLLTLARGEKPVTSTDEIDLAELVRHALTLLPHDRIDVRTDLRPAVTHGSVALLDRLVLNLLGNAIQHNSPGGWVSVATEGDLTSAVLRISNSGPVIAAHEVPGLLEPFTRGRDRVGPGNGLGLSIAAAVVSGHGGELSVQARAEGGLAVSVRLPRNRTS
jgi:signal transduction histidine kinase